MTSDRSYAVSIEDALTRLDVIDYDAGTGEGPCVHTFAQSGFGLLGAHWYLSELEPHMRRWGVEEAGAEAKAMRHGLVVISDAPGPLFLATKETPADAA